MTRQQAGRHVVTLLLVVVTAVCLLASALLVLWSMRSREIVEPPPPRPAAVFPQPQLKTVSSEGYVGSRQCAVCHDDVHDSYQTHPMSRSLAAIGSETPVEDWDAAAFTTSEVRRYEVLRRDGKQLHAEIVFDEQGEIIRQQEEIAFALGSGERGRSYLVNHEGIVFQSPIGWYSQAGKFDLSPGYDGPASPHFNRRVGDGCLYCHSGRLAADEPGSDRYQRQVFHEQAIGCERCHGPGRGHIAFQSGRPAAPDEFAAAAGGPERDPIVNPAKLEPALRDAVCYQCHLQSETAVLRRGRTPLDFRPGDRIEDVWVAFVLAGAEDEVKAVGQVQQMRSSSCFQASDGRMGCVSCHDPHAKPPAEQRAKYFDSRCLSCHQSEDACGESPQARLAAPAAGSCIACHMPAREGGMVPHAAHTDHRIQRRPTRRQAPAAEAVEAYEVFADADQRLPRPAVERARGLAMMTRSDIAADIDRLKAAEYLLIPPTVRDQEAGTPLPAIGDDVPVLNALARNLMMQGREKAALQCWQEALKHDPKNEQALDALTSYHHQKGDQPTTLKLLRQMAEANPYVANLYGRRAHVLGRMGDMEVAIESAKMCIRLDPHNLLTQRWLADALRLVDRPQQAREQEARAARLERALRREHGAP